jgi:polar amino acid transport system substrate-binding protein
MLQALQRGRIDAAALTTISLASLAQTSDFTGIEVTEGFAYRGELGCGAFGFRVEDARLRDEFNRILHQLRDNDELVRIVEPFGFAQAAEAAQGLTAQDLCDR